jgi:uncharacterized protein (DUF427 family)
MGEQELFRSADGVAVHRRGDGYGDRPEGITFEPTERWIRARVGDTYLVDSKSALLQWETGIPCAAYLFPAADVRTDLFRARPAPTDRPRLLVAEWFDVEVEGRVLERLAWRYAEGPLAGYVGIDWFGRPEPGVDHWYEEDEEVWVHPRDPHKRVDAIPSSRHVKVSLDGRTLAESTHPVLLYETWLPVRYYLPADDVDQSRLQATDLLTRCPYKGIAHYWSVTDAEQGKNIVWTYPEPIAAVEAVRDHVCFYNEFVDIEVDGVPVDRPQTHFVQRVVDDAPDTTGV